MNVTYPNTRLSELPAYLNNMPRTIQPLPSAAKPHLFKTPAIRTVPYQCLEVRIQARSSSVYSSPNTRYQLDIFKDDLEPMNLIHSNKLA